MNEINRGKTYAVSLTTPGSLRVRLIIVIHAGRDMPDRVIRDCLEMMD